MRMRWYDVSLGAAVASLTRSLDCAAIGPLPAQTRVTAATTAAHITNRERIKVRAPSLSGEQVVDAAEQPARAPLRDQILQAPLRTLVGIDAQRPLQQRLEL